MVVFQLRYANKGNGVMHDFILANSENEAIDIFVNNRTKENYKILSVSEIACPSEYKVFSVNKEDGSPAVVEWRDRVFHKSGRLSMWQDLPIKDIETWA